MDYVLRAVWGMLYADDACVVSRSPQGLGKMMVLVLVVANIEIYYTAVRSEGSAPKITVAIGKDAGEPKSC